MPSAELNILDELYLHLDRDDEPWSVHVEVGVDAASLAYGIVIDPSTGVFTWTPSEAQGAGSYGVTVTVTAPALQRRSGLTRAVLRGIVTAAGSGAPVAEALATLLDEHGGIVASAVTGPDGTFEIAGLPAGTYTLTARGATSAVRVVHVTAGSVTSAVVEVVPPGADPEGVAPTRTGSLR